MDTQFELTDEQLAAVGGGFFDVNVTTVKTITANVCQSNWAYAPTNNTVIGSTGPINQSGACITQSNTNNQLLTIH